MGPHDMPMTSVPSHHWRNTPEALQHHAEAFRGSFISAPFGAGGILGTARVGWLRNRPLNGIVRFSPLNGVYLPQNGHFKGKTPMMNTMWILGYPILGQAQILNGD